MNRVRRQMLSVWSGNQKDFSHLLLYSTFPDFFHVLFRNSSTLKSHVHSCKFCSCGSADIWFSPLKILQTTISDLVQIPPKDFAKKSAASIEDYINDKYANKVAYPSYLVFSSAQYLIKSIVGYPENWSLYLPIWPPQSIRRPYRPWHWNGQCEW